MRDPTSHTAASVAGFGFVPPPEMVAFTDWLEVFANSHRGKTSVPVRVDRPWLNGSRAATPKPVSPESKARRRALAERLGLDN